MKQSNQELRHRHSIRLSGYDYSQGGLYFITICTHERVLTFGNISDKKMILSPCGETANKFWESIASHFNNVKLHEHIVMPNHIHGIVEIAGAINQGAINQGAINRAPTAAAATTAATTAAVGGFAGTMNPMLCVNLSRIIRWYKGRTTYECRKMQLEFAWQRNYYEHIIRTEQDYVHIAQYIKNNPAKWQEDQFFTP